MKARVIETGEIVDVDGGEYPDPWYLTKEKAYHEDELEFFIDKGK